MTPLKKASDERWHAIRAIGFDIDDTITDDGRISARAYEALWDLFNADFRLIAVTGRPAGWCDMIARAWPVDGVLGENGALFYRRDGRSVQRRDFGTPPAPGQLEALAESLLAQFPELRVASDQFTRRFDLAIDFAEEVGPFPPQRAEEVRAAFEAAGATAKVSSIHVNGWFGDWDKASSLQQVLRSYFDLDLHQLAYIGDSPNDGPLFRHAAFSVGVANIRAFATLLDPPDFITDAPRGAGFAEFAATLLKKRCLP
jgi:HAD superfamily hydrolase (TIGR01484 family)